MYLVNKHDDVLVLLQFLHQLAQSLLELSTILGACHDGSHVERINFFAEEHGRGVMLGNHLCQSLDDGALTDARFTY